MFHKLKKQYLSAGLVMILLAVGAFFMANVELPPRSHYLSAVNVILFALPSLWALRWWLGWRNGVILTLTLGIYALAIETLAIFTGFPYGHFGYSDLLGYRIVGLVPWTVALAWTPLMLGAYGCASQFFTTAAGRVIAATLIITLFDLVLDPGAVLLGFWQYEGGGWFYGVPLSNFAGWLVSGAIGAALMEILIRRFDPLLPVPVQLISSVVLIVFFWTMIAAFGGMLLPAAIGIVIFVSLVAIYRWFYFRFDDKIVFVDDDNIAIGTGDKLPSHNSETRLHRAFSVFLFNQNGELLLQQRALSKKTWPGVWSNSCCGHVMLHESVEAAAERRIRYELGLRKIVLAELLPEYRYRAELGGMVENEICPVFVGFTDSEPTPNDAEVANVKWMDWESFLREVAKPESGLSPWAREEALLLANSDEFRMLYGSRTTPSRVSGE